MLNQLSGSSITLGQIPERFELRRSSSSFPTLFKILSANVARDVRCEAELEPRYLPLNCFIERQTIRERVAVNVCLYPKGSRTRGRRARSRGERRTEFSQRVRKPFASMREFDVENSTNADVYLWPTSLAWTWIPWHEDKYRANVASVTRLRAATKEKKLRLPVEKRIGSCSVAGKRRL